MVDVQQQSGLPDDPINGFELPERPLIGAISAADRAVGDPDREATRYLAAATQVRVEFAEFVIDKVINERFRALAPTFGVDVPVVAKWAIKALRTRARREFALGILLIPLLLVPLFTFFWLRSLILLPVVFILAWLIVAWEHWERIHNVVARKMLRDRFDPANAPLPKREADRERLREVAERRDGNLVVFRGHSAFIGSGTHVAYHRIVLDVSRGKAAKDGASAEPKPFSSQDLHTAVLKAFDNKTGLAKSLDNVRAYERLFVNGLHVQGDERLLPNESPSPLTVVDKDLLVTAALHPTPEARTYVCVEMTGWKGQLVVTLFIRGVHTGKSLYIEWTFRVLPPIRKEYLEIDHLYEMSWPRQLGASLRVGLSETITAFFGAPFRAFGTWHRPHIARRHHRRQAQAIARGSIFNYGAGRSIREYVCGRQRQHYFLARDESMYVLLAEQALTRAIGEFLDEHDVDLGEFNSQRVTIFNQTTNLFGDIKDSRGVVIGNNSSAKVSDSGKGTK